MKRNLGRSELQVSLVGLGCNNFGRRLDLSESRKVIHRALDLGVTLFDTADVYGSNGASETYIGATLGARRKEVVIATKFGCYTGADSLLGRVKRKLSSLAGPTHGASGAYIRTAVERSLRRLKTDWIDLYQLHFPDPRTPLEETLRALDDLVRAGKIRAYGVSNFSTTQIDAAQQIARELSLRPIASTQAEYSLLRRDVEDGLLAGLVRNEVSLLPYYPLASGLLSGKYRLGAAHPAATRLATDTALASKFMTGADLAMAEKLHDFAREHGRTLLELAFGWLAAQPAVASIIAGASTPEQLEQNVAAAERRLSADDAAGVGAVLNRS